MSSVKEKRHRLILDIIRDNVIKTQDELVAALNEHNIATTQATLSRDLRELNIHKRSDKNGVIRLVSPGSNTQVNLNDKFISIINSSFVSVDYANNLVVLRTLAGMAQAVAAVFDSRQYDGILGTVAGDDTVLIICRDELGAEDIVKTLKPFGENNA